MNIKEIILGRVAAKMGVDPLKLIKSLNESYYAKFAGIVQEPDGEAEIIYPSQQAYDFDKIKRNRMQEQLAKVEDAKIITPEEEKKADDTKSKILEKLRNKQKELDKKTNVINTKAKNKDGK